MFRRMISIITAAVVSLNMLTIMPANVFAANGDSKVYEKDGYTVTYSVGSEWDNNQTIEVEISNTGEESILNWALKYDAGGSLDNIWNAKLYSSADDYIVVKNNGYNYEIEPGQAVKYGYTLTSAADTPAELPGDIEICSRRTEVESGFEVELKTTNIWDTGFQAEVEIKNTSKKPIEAWTLTFDSNFEINNYWNCKILDNNNCKYTVANKLWTTPIKAGESASFGFTASLNEGEKTPNAENWLLTEVIVDEPKENPGEENSEFELACFAEYNKETGSIIISWITKNEGGTFDILYSDDGIDFNSAASVKDTYNYEYKITEPFSKRYFKIVQTLNNGRVGESDALLICKDENGYSMEFPDTDSDEIPDYLEKAFGLDINKQDTDDDGLSDYEEMMLTGTDPTVYASVKEGVSDSDADSDNDGLSNRKEIELGTDPVTKDTDNDGLSDGDEVGKYNTDPLKSDTDNDSITDGDETAVGLDPLDPNTYGVPDSEYTFYVDLSDDSEAMSEINSDNDYKLSVEIKAAGNVEKNIDVRGSDYSNTIQNSAIVGKIFDIAYDNSCKTEKVVLKFNLDKEKAVGSDNDIERFCVFKLFEEYNVILPVYTEYNSDENLVYAGVDELGTYCLMDMEKLTQNIKSNEPQFEESTAALSLNGSPVVYANSSNVSWQNTIDKSAVNVVFIMDTRDNIDKESFDSIKSNVVKAASEILKESPSAKIYLILQHYVKSTKDNLGYTLIKDKDEVYFTDSVRIYEELDRLDTYSVNQFNKSCVLSDAIKYVFDNCNNSKGTYCFSIFDSADVVYRASRPDEGITGVTKSDDYGYEVLKRLSENRIDVSIISNIAPEYNLGYAIDIYKSTGGIYIDGFSGFSDEILYHIYGYIPDHDKESTAFYNGLNFEEMKLKSEVTAEYLSAFNELTSATETAEKNKKYSEISEIRARYSSFADTDDDGAYDFEEIDMRNELIKWDNNAIILPTIQEYADIIGDSKVKRAMKEYIKENWNPLLKIRLMPVISNPMNQDTDGDGLLDGKPYEYNGVTIAPTDTAPLVLNGSKELWMAHIENVKNNNIPSEVSSWYGYTDPQLENTEGAGFQALLEELLFLAVSKKIDLLEFDVYTYAKSLAYSCCLCQQGDTKGYAIIKFFMNEFKSKVVNPEEADGIMASLGSRLLNFKSDSTIGGYNGVLHSQPRSWQFIGGFNNVYDVVFKFGTNNNVSKEKFPFTVGDTEYIVWVWRGDYLNLGAGAEIGIYSRPDWLSQDPDFIDHYFVDYDLAMPMQLYLYECNGQDIDNVFSWNPNDKQWWITGWNPEYVDKVDVKKLVSVGCIDFAGHEDMYDALKENVSGQRKIKDYMIFDDRSVKAWLCWDGVD